MEYLRRYLKVCEGCGGLWVRAGVAAGVYCRHCGPRMADLPAQRRLRPGRPCRINREQAKQAGGAA
jgi:hypothetical protein